MSVILSYIQTQPLLEARKRGNEVVETSLDLGRSVTSVTLSTEGVSFASGERLDWASVEEISKDNVNCYIIEAEGMKPMRIFSKGTNRLCSLMPTEGAPSLLIAGFVMHRIKEVDPWQHAQRMIATIAPMRGYVLDTATGLGYTTILAAREAKNVTTIELDQGVQTIANLNPWSQELFHNPKIRQILGDATEIVQFFEDESFSRIIHDPPTFKLAGELYSGTFYRELYRILQRGGRLFHYIGDPNSKASSSVTRGVVRRLQEASFSRVARRAEAYGVVAYK
jgi:predicted methyltransferase